MLAGVFNIISLSWSVAINSLIVLMNKRMLNSSHIVLTSPPPPPPIILKLTATLPFLWNFLYTNACAPVWATIFDPKTTVVALTGLSASTPALP